SAPTCGTSAATNIITAYSARGCPISTTATTRSIPRCATSPAPGSRAGPTASASTPSAIYSKMIGEWSLIFRPLMIISCGSKRTPIPWSRDAPGFGFTTGTPWRSRPEPAGVDVESERADPNSLWQLYRALIALHRQEIATRRGTFTRVENTPDGVVEFVWGGD